MVVDTTMVEEVEEVRDFASVARDDAADRAERCAEPPPDFAAEATVLPVLFEDAAAVAACAATLGARWDSVCQRVWTVWAGAPSEQLGAEIARVVDTLNAPHLLPSSIHERLVGGNAAASFGLATLLGNMHASPEAAVAAAAAAEAEARAVAVAE